MTLVDINGNTLLSLLIRYAAAVCTFQASGYLIKDIQVYDPFHLQNQTSQKIHLLDSYWEKYISIADIFKLIYSIPQNHESKGPH